MGRKKALIVDDDPDTRVAFRHYLQAAGFEVVAEAATVGDGQQAFDDHRDAAVIIMDGQLGNQVPDALIRWMIDESFHGILIGVSASRSTELLAAGCHVTFPKNLVPVKLPIILNLIASRIP